MEQQRKKTMRHFYCRDVLWEAFEQMAQDFDCSIDYLLNEAMRSYARSKKYAVPAPSSSSERTPTGPIADAIGRPATGVDRAVDAAFGAVASGRSAGLGTAAAGGPPTPTPTPTPLAAVPRLSSPPRPSPSRPMPIVAPPRTEGLPGGTLVLLFDNRRIPIEKDQFIIGRGSKTSDLPIKDGNISRKHAAIIRRNGSFYIKDLGSTNGIDFKGMRIDNKRIDEGDVFHLCDYELKFTYQDS